MALGREILLLICVAVLTSLSGTAQGILDKPTWSITNIGENQNSNDGTQIATRDSNPPFQFGVSCSCEKLTHCMCAVTMNSNIMGAQFEFNPQLHVEFVDRNVTLKTYVTNGNEILMFREYSGETFIPPVCVPVPQFPAIQLCVEFQNLTLNLDDQSAGLCLVANVRVAGVSLPNNLHPPTLPIGCFAATLGKELVYTPPAIAIPGFENSKPLLGDKITVPLTPPLIWPLGQTGSFWDQNKKNDINSMNFAPNRFF